MLEFHPMGVFPPSLTVIWLRRALSQECQMRAWNTIRRLTHRARERRMLGMKEEGYRGEALKGVLAEV